ncbi:MAG: prepilin-type N-terminal cleavage/methylation domain-containing protein [Phycisphaerae bacterium]
MSKKRHNQHDAFSLLELVIVVAIIAILAAIAIPRMSRGSKGAGDSALSGDLTVLRNAIDIFAAEHVGTFPTVADITNQLTQYTDVNGTAQAAKDPNHIYGPYVRKIPPLPVGNRKGGTGIAAADAAGVGWLYDQTTGTIKANCQDTETDDAGKKYNEY